MAEQEIDILLLQETYVLGSPTYSTEQGKYTVYLSGSEPDPNNPRMKEKAGVGAILSHTAQAALQNITAHSARLQTLRFRTQGGILNIANVYAPQNGRSLAERRQFYEQLHDVVARHQGRHPYYIIGDLNARIHKAYPDETSFFGPYIYGDPEWEPRATVLANKGQSPSEDIVNTNRLLLKEFCARHSYLVKNTFLQKTPGKQITYVDPSQPNKMAPPRDLRTGKVTRHPTGTKNYHFAQLDLVLVQPQWAPSVTDIESKRSHFVYWTRHFPVHIDIKLRLRAHRPHTRSRRPAASILNSPTAGPTRIEVKQALLNALPALTGTETVEELWAGLTHATYEGMTKLPTPEQPPRRPYTSPLTLTLIQQRNAAERRGDPHGAKQLQKAVKKSVRKDKAQYLNEALQSGNWSSVVKHKKPFAPQTHRLKAPGGEIVGSADLAEVQATYYANHQWNVPHQPQQPAQRQPLHPVSQQIPTGPFSMQELRETLQKLKTNKAPGPDGIPNEIWKMLLKITKDPDAKDLEQDLNGQILEYVLTLINTIHREKKIPDAWNDANIAALFKGGDSSDPDRYRPIALLITAYKIYTRMIHQRLTVGLEERLRETQYGFRPNRSAPEAIALLLRLLDHSLSNKHEDEIHIVLLDWVKAFDKLSHTGLLDALRRLGVPPDLIEAIEMLYREPRFQVVTRSSTSAKHRQHSGIRQGCPLSPYLFVAWMTVMMHDAETDFYTIWPLLAPPAPHIPLKARLHVRNPFPCNDIAYADDLTILARLSIHAQEYLKAIERRAEEDNMRLNASKTHHLQFRGQPQTISTMNNTPLKKQTQARMLGTMIKTGTPKDRARLALNTRLGEARTAFDTLYRIWKHTHILPARKIIIYRACVIQKLTYALYTHVIAKADLARLEAFHVQCLRKILGIKTTHAAKNILYTEAVPNDEVLRRAHEHPIKIDIANMQAKLYAHAYRRPIGHPARITLFERTTSEAATWRGTKPQGRPYTTWHNIVTPTIKQLYHIEYPEKQYTQRQGELFMVQNTPTETAAARFARLAKQRTAMAKDAMQKRMGLDSYISTHQTKIPLILAPPHPAPTHATKTHAHPPQYVSTGPAPAAWWPAQLSDLQTSPPLKPPAMFTSQTTIYTDGSGASGRAKATHKTPAGWGFVAMDTHVRQEVAGAVLTNPNDIRWLGAYVGSNNTGELTAILEGAVWAYHTPNITAVDFRYDSKYAANLADENWQPQSNFLLVAAVRAALRQLKTRVPVTFTHVKAHSGDLWNERVDALAKYGSRMFVPPP